MRYNLGLYLIVSTLFCISFKRDLFTKANFISICCYIYYITLLLAPSIENGKERNVTYRRYEEIEGS